MSAGEKVNLKIREAQLQKIPYMLVVGDREAQSGSVSVRNRKHGDQGSQSVDEFLAEHPRADRDQSPDRVSVRARAGGRCAGGGIAGL